MKLVTDSRGTTKEVAFKPKYKVAICVPCGDQVAAGFAYDLSRLMSFTIAMEPEIELALIFQKSSLLPASRAGLAEQAIAFDSDYLLCIDSDMRFQKDALLRLMTVAESAKISMVAANYPTRKEPVLPVSFSDIDGNERVYTEVNETAIQEVSATGFGFILIRQDVFTTMDKPWFMLGYSPEKDDYQGEDVYFFVKAKANGHAVYIDPVVTLGVSHLGEYEFGNSDALAYREGLRVKAAKETEASK